MLTGERIKPYLLHEDRWLRVAAVHYFYESWSRDADLVPMVLAGCERFGLVESVPLLSCCRRFPLTESAFQAALALLAETEDANTIMHLGGMIASAPVELLANNEMRVFDNKHLLAEYRPKIQHRLGVSRWSDDRLWHELQDFSLRSADAKFAGEIDHAYADALVEALARCSFPDADTVCRLLADKEVEEQWLEMFLIDLAGERRMKPAIPLLVERFHVDTDYMLERCHEALAKLGDPEAVRLIRAAFPAATWDFKCYTSSLMGDIKHPDSEDAIIALLETERDVGVRTDLCLSLCNLFSERGIEIVLAQIVAGYDEMMVTLEEVLLPVTQVLGVELPEAERWRQEREERERRLAARLAELDSGDWQQADEAQTATFAPRPENEADFETYGSVPFRRQDVKVGRNEPCPCGSGKKFKRCCGRE